MRPLLTFLESKMKSNPLLILAEAVIKHYWKSPRVKQFVLLLLDRYAKSTDNDVDDIIVGVVRSKLFPS